MDNRSPSPPLSFPTSRDRKVLAIRSEEQSMLPEDAEIFELCHETLGALQELRHGIQFALYDKLESVNLDVEKLANLIEEDPDTACALIEKEVDELSTERLIDILERLQLRTRRV